MANVIYENIMDRAVLVRVLVKNKTPLARAAKQLQVPYNCLRDQAIRKLTSEEWEIVISRRDRRTYSYDQKKLIVQKAEEIKKQLKTEDSKLTWKKARIEAYKTVATKYDLKLSLLMSWRRAFIEEKRLKKESKTNASTKKKSTPR